MIHGKSLRKLMTTGGVYSSQENLHEYSQKNIVFNTTFQGQIELEQFRNIVKWLEAYKEGAFEKYQELKQHLHSFLG